MSKFIRRVAGSRARGLLAATASLALALAVGAPSAHAAPPAYKVTGSIAGADGGWDYGTFDPSLRRFYVSHADSVFAVDVDSGKVIEKLGEAPRGHKVVPLDGGRTLAVTSSGLGGLRFIDAATGATLADAPTGKGPDSAIFDPASGLVAVANHGGGDLVMVDPKTRKATGSVMIGGALEEVVADGSGKLYLNVEDKNELVSIDSKTLKITHRVKLEGCDGPTGLVFAEHARALVASCGNGKAAVIDVKTMKLEGLLTIGQGPDAALYDPARRLVIIPCGGTGTLSVIDARSAHHLKTVATVTTEKSARLGALDPKTGTIYLPAARFLPPAPGARRGSLEPGSFHIIVVSPAS